MLLFLMLAAETPDLSWLAGTWCTEPKNGAVTCESWTPMDEGVMRGSGTTRKNGRTTTNETMAIIVNETGVIFHAEPVNQPPADFRAVRLDSAGRSVTFEERSHDYPQRVRYWRDGEALLAETSLLDGSRAARWSFHRSPN